MADPDSDGKGEVTKDVLAPVDEPREDMIATAVKFLQNPKVRQSPLHQKKAFLQRKGLTSEEIDIAVQRSGALQDDKVTQVFPPQPPGQVAAYNTPPPAAVLEYTRWQKTRDVLSMIALASGITYAAYKFFKEILHPWWSGKPGTSDRLDRMEKNVSELQVSVVDTLAKLQECVTALQDQMAKDQEKVQNLSHEVYTIKKFGRHTYQGNETLQTVQDSQTLNDIKSDLTSIKGLLLNRKQFPPTPLSTPTLPSWQLSSASPTSSVNMVKPPLVTPSGDTENNLTDALAMLNSNESSRTEDDEDIKKKTVTFSEASITDTKESSDKETKDDVTEVKPDISKAEFIGQQTNPTINSETKPSEDELD